MTFLTWRLGSRGGRPGAGDGWPAHWRAVPVVDVFPRVSGRLPTWDRNRIAGGAVVFLELIGILFLFFIWQGAKGDIETKQATLESVKEQRAAALQEINQLQDRVEELQQQAPPGGTQAPRVDWGTALSGLYQMEVPGIDLGGVAVQEDSDSGVVVTGSASDIQAMASFQSALGNISHLFDLRSIRWESSGETLSFTAVMEVVAREGGSGAN